MPPMSISDVCVLVACVTAAAWLFYDAMPKKKKKSKVTSFLEKIMSDEMDRTRMEYLMRQDSRLAEPRFKSFNGPTQSYVPQNRLPRVPSKNAKYRRGFK